MLLYAAPTPPCHLNAAPRLPPCHLNTALKPVYAAPAQPPRCLHAVTTQPQHPHHAAVDSPTPPQRRPYTPTKPPQRRPHAAASRCIAPQAAAAHLRPTICRYGEKIWGYGEGEVGGSGVKILEYVKRGNGEKIDTHAHTSAGIQAQRSALRCKPGACAPLYAWEQGLAGCSSLGTAGGGGRIFTGPWWGCRPWGPTG